MPVRYKFQPNYAVHPGETLREKLEEINMSPKEFAIRTGKPIKTISEVINGKSSITPEMAIQFEKVLEIPASFWMQKMANYNEYIARKKYREEIENHKEWVKKFPYSKLAKLGYVKPTKKIEEKIEELLAFFNVSNLTAWENIYFNEQIPAFFRISLKQEKNPYALASLLRIGEIEANKMREIPSFNKKKLREEGLPKLKEIMIEDRDDFLVEIKKVCASCGVKIVYTPNLPKTSVNGVVRWIKNNPVIQITDRYKRYDIFWFSLFHELGHVLLHGKKKNIFLDEIENIDETDIKEQEANRFAREYLLKEKEYNTIIREIGYKAKTKKEVLGIIEHYAKKFNTHKDIIIGRMLYENKELYEYGFLKKQIRKVDFKDLLNKEGEYDYLY